MTNELQTVGAMHQCRVGEPYSTCVYCGALAEALNKPCPHFVRDAMRKLSAVASPTPQADSQPAPVVDRARIREIFMAHGFTVKEGQTDLKQYVYDAADALLRAASAPADSVPPMTAADAQRYAEIEANSGASDFATGIPQAADSQPAPQGETNAQLDIDSNSSAPGQQRDVAGSVALGQPVGNGSDQAAGHTGAQGDKLLIVAERNIRSFLRSAVFKSESDREAALNCVDVLWEAASAPADPQLLKFYGVTTDAELIAAQARHIERLQAKLPQTQSFAPQRVREG